MCHQLRIAPGDSVLRGFARTLNKLMAPQNGLGIGQVSRDQSFFLGGRHGKIDDRGQSLHAPADFIARVHNAAGSIEKNALAACSLNFVQGFVHGLNFRCQIFPFAFAIGWLVGPSHPCRDSSDAAVVALGQFRSKFFLNAIVNADHAQAGSRQLLRPVGLAGAGHSDERQFNHLASDSGDYNLTPSSLRGGDFHPGDRAQRIASLDARCKADQIADQEVTTFLYTSGRVAKSRRNLDDMQTSNKLWLAGWLTGLLIVSSPIFARNSFLASQAPGSADVPVVSAGAGSCDANFTVNDSSGKAIYDAKIRIQLKYGFMGLHKLDATVGTNYEGKARIEGLPEQIKGTAEFRVTHAGQGKSLPFDPEADCHPRHEVVLGEK